MKRDYVLIYTIKLLKKLVIKFLFTNLIVILLKNLAYLWQVLKISK